MSLVPPNLDDRDWAALVAEARAYIQRRAPEWTDLSPHDPGMVLVEVFAHLTETMIYRLNRIPEKVYVELLRLIGVERMAPAAASTTIHFELDKKLDRPLAIPLGTRIIAGDAPDGSAITFQTVRSAELKAGETSADVRAIHGEQVRGARLGVAHGRPGLWLRIQDRSILDHSEDVEVEIGVAAETRELESGTPGREHEGKAYRLWREVESFANLGKNDPVFLMDRASGLVRFAPAIERSDGSLEAIAGVPAAGREVRAWYWRGGGPSGNVAAGMLSKLAAPPNLPAGATLSVTNREAARGGRSIESLENALLRGPESLRTLERAVTARDFEIIARRATREVSRARAFTAAEVWRHAQAGSVEVLLVPALPENTPPLSAEAVTLEMLAQQETEPLRRRVQTVLDERRPVGTRCRVKWARYKRVHIKARVVAHRGEDLAALEQRVLHRLHTAIAPVATGDSREPWEFGEPLRASHVWRVALAEPGVSYVDRVRFKVDDVPRNVEVLEADPAQKSMWFAGAGVTLFRTMNDGVSWEVVAGFEGKAIEVVERHPQIAGLLAVSVRSADGKRSELHWSYDAGETWADRAHEMPLVHDLAWTAREGVPWLWIATEVGLYELDMSRAQAPLQVEVDPAAPRKGFYAVAAAIGPRGDVKVAAAATEMAGVYLSAKEGRGGTFENIGLGGKDARVLAVQYDGSRSFLWAGLNAHGPQDPGEGCTSCELTGSAAKPVWTAFAKGWKGGSCKGLAFFSPGSPDTAIAGTHSAGVLRINARNPEAAVWVEPVIDCGLPHASAQRLFDIVTSIAAREELVLAGGARGVFASKDGAKTYEPVAEQELTEVVMLPKTWLFCSGTHELEVVSRDEAE